jgi:hypothetical protein
MLQVVCTESELAEDGVVVTVGDVVSRVSVPFRGGYFGSDLDGVPWMFDQYAAGFSDRDDVVVLAGRVTAIAAIYVRLSSEGRDGWTPIPGSARLASLTSTRDTWRPQPKIIWDVPATPHPDGGYSARGYAERNEGDEDFSGWLFTLEHTSSVPLDVGRAAASR